MAQRDFDVVLEEVVQRDPRYHRDAYQFVREALDHTQLMLQRQSEGKQRHVSGAQLLDGIREFALKEFGPLAMTVFEEWGIRCCEDFGEIVFNMVEHKILRATPDDSREDFKGRYQFEEAFRRPFQPKLAAGQNHQ